MSPDRGVADSRAQALLKESEVTAEQTRAACITLADAALLAADGDEGAAKGMLREVLEEIGALPYPVPPRRKQFGHRQGEST